MNLITFIVGIGPFKRYWCRCIALIVHLVVYIYELLVIWNLSFYQIICWFCHFTSCVYFWRFNECKILRSMPSAAYEESQSVREDLNGKKTFSFGHCPNPLTPPPWPQFGQLGPLFLEVEIQDLKVSLELRILYVLYNILYICNLKNS